MGFAVCLFFYLQLPPEFSISELHARIRVGTSPLERFRAIYKMGERALCGKKRRLVLALAGSLEARSFP